MAKEIDSPHLIAKTLLTRAEVGDRIMRLTVQVRRLRHQEQRDCPNNSE